MIPVLVIAVPFASALAGLRRWPGAPWLNLAASAVTFGLACALPWVAQFPSWMLADPLAIHLAILVAFIALTSAWPSRSALSQALLGCLLLALLSGNAGLTWAAAEAATVVLALLARPQAWRVLVIGSAGLALALFGTVLLAAATGSADWSAIPDGQPDAILLDLAFAFLFAGYVTFALLGLLCEWRDRPAVLPGCFIAVAVLVVLRLRGLLDDNADAVAPGVFLVAAGLALVLGAAVSLRRPPGVPRLLCLAGTAQGGLALIAFGLGEPGATFAGLLQVTAGTLLQAAASQSAAGTRTASLTFAAALLGLAGSPPFGLFTSEALILLAAVPAYPLLALAAFAGIGALAVAIIGRLPAPGTPATLRASLSLAGAWLQLAAAAMLGFAMPSGLAGWMHGIAAAAR